MIQEYLAQITVDSGLEEVKLIMFTEVFSRLSGEEFINGECCLSDSLPLIDFFYFLFLGI